MVLYDFDRLCNPVSMKSSINTCGFHTHKIRRKKRGGMARFDKFLYQMFNFAWIFCAARFAISS